jgi:hypothetical protein
MAEDDLKTSEESSDSSSSSEDSGSSDSNSSSSDSSSSDSSSSGSEPESTEPAAAAEKPEIESFTAEPESFTKGSDAKIRLSWKIKGDPKTISIDGVDQSIEASATSVEVTPQDTTEYTLKVSNDAGDTEQTCKVEAKEEEKKEEEKKDEETKDEEKKDAEAKDEEKKDEEKKEEEKKDEDTKQKLEIESFTASETEIEKGKTATLEWKLSGKPTEISIADLEGASLGPDDTSCVVTPEESRDYVLTVKNEAGEEASKTVHVDVKAAAEAASIESFTASSEGVEEGKSIQVAKDARVTFKWQLKGEPGSIELSGHDGKIDPKDTSVELAVSSSAEYTLMLKGPDGATADSATVQVDVDEVGSGNAHQTETGRPTIDKFTASDGSSDDLEHSVQVTKGTKVKFSWSVQGDVTEVTLTGVAEKIDAKTTEWELTPEKDLDYELVVKNEVGKDSRTVHVSVNSEGEVVSGHATVSAAGDVVCNPPVRLLTQFDARLSKVPMAGSDNSVSWISSGCAPCSYAAVLRWYAEDNSRTAGKVRFPSRSGTEIPAEHYPRRMLQVFFPKLEGTNPRGKCGLDKSFHVDYGVLFAESAKALGSKKDVTRYAKGNAKWWMDTLRGKLQNGPLVINFTKPAGHFVVLQGIKDDKLLLVDPGNIVSRKGPKEYKDDFQTGAGMPDEGQWKTGSVKDERDSRCYVAVGGKYRDYILDSLYLAQGYEVEGGGSVAASSDAGETGGEKAEEKPAEEKPAEEKPADAEKPADGGASDGEKPQSAEAGKWEEYADGRALPVEIVEQIKSARAKYPAIDLKKKGEHKYSYYGTSAHKKYLLDWVKTKIDGVSGKSDKFAAMTFRDLLSREGSTSSWNTWDNQIVTWGTGFSAIASLPEFVLPLLNQQQAAREKLRAVGFVWVDKQGYRLVDVNKGAVVVSKGKDHKAAAEAWRQQPDLLTAMSGISEDAESRDGVSEAMFQGYKKMSASFDASPIHTQALFGFVSHMHHWLPAFAKAGWKEAAAEAGSGASSEERDCQLAITFAKRFQVHASKHPKYGKIDIKTPLKRNLERCKKDGLSGLDPNAAF